MEKNTKAGWGENDAVLEGNGGNDSPEATEMS
jgi:hypothetical protein